MVRRHSIYSFVVRVVFASAIQKVERHLNTIVSTGRRAEKFNIVSNDHGRTQKTILPL